MVVLLGRQGRIREGLRRPRHCVTGPLCTGGKGDRPGLEMQKLGPTGREGKQSSTENSHCHKQGRDRDRQAGRASRTNGGDSRIQEPKRRQYFSSVEAPTKKGEEECAGEEILKM